MNTSNVSTTRLLAAALFAANLLAGCSTMVGKATTPLTAKREEPGVVLCQSERTSGGGLRIVGKLNAGIYPIIGTSIQYRTMDAADAVPATSAGGSLELSGARTEKVSYSKGANEIAFAIDSAQARGLDGKVLWYRWIVDYDKGGSDKRDVTDIHRTSLEEAGLPRSADTPGPDSSVALAGSRLR